MQGTQLWVEWGSGLVLGRYTPDSTVHYSFAVPCDELALPKAALEYAMAPD